MEDLEKQIEEAALVLRRKECPKIYDDYTNGLSVGIEFGFKEGLKSPEAKDYWQQNMYSEEDMLNFSFWLLNNIGETSNDRVAHFDNRHYLNKWLEQNKKK